MKTRFLLLLLLTILICKAADAQTPEDLVNYAISAQGFDKSIEFVNNALEIDPGYVPAYLAKAAIYSEMDNYEAALQACDKAISIAPHYREAYRIRAGIKEDVGDIQGAKEDRRIREQLIKEGKSYWLEKANKDLKEAEDALKKQGQAPGKVEQKQDGGSDYAKSLLQRARLKARNGNYKEAIEDYTRYQQTVELINDTSFVGKAKAQRQLNDLEGALKTYTEMITYFPESAVCYEKRAELYEKMGKEEKAEQDRAAMKYLYWQNKHESEEFLSKKIKEYPEKQSLYISRAKYRLQLNDIEGALADYKKALELADDKNAKLWLEAYVERTQQDLAERDEQKILKQQAFREKGEALVKKYKKKHLEMKMKEAQPDPDANSSAGGPSGKKTDASDTEKIAPSEQPQAPRPNQTDTTNSRPVLPPVSGSNYALLGLAVLGVIGVLGGVIAYLRRKRK